MNPQPLPPGSPRSDAERKAVEELLRRMRQDKAEKVPPPPKREADRKRDESATVSPEKARVVVRLPADARLWVDQVECPLTGTIRSFDTPNLDPAQSYAYTLRVAVQRDGQTVQDSRRVTLTPGQAVEVNFNDVATVRTASATE